MLEEDEINKLAQKAYEAHVGINNDDVAKWEELPARTKAHWKNIVFVVSRHVTEINCKDCD
jgi:hypothetical protein